MRPATAHHQGRRQSIRPSPTCRRAMRRPCASSMRRSGAMPGDVASHTAYREVTAAQTWLYGPVLRSWVCTIMRCSPWRSTRRTSGGCCLIYRHPVDRGRVLGDAVPRPRVREEHRGQLRHVPAGEHRRVSGLLAGFAAVADARHGHLGWRCGVTDKLVACEPGVDHGRVLLSNALDRILILGGVADFFSLHAFGLLLVRVQYRRHGYCCWCWRAFCMIPFAVRVAIMPQNQRS